MRNRVSIAALALAAAGCTATTAPPDVPLDAPHAPSLQKSTRAVHHWDVLAGDVAAHVAGRLRDWPQGRHPLYVAAAPQGSGFDAGFRELLVTQLVERGVAVDTQPTAVRLQVLTQLVQHHAWAPLEGGQALADGVRVRRGVDGLAPSDPGGPMRTEILVVTSLESEGHVLVRTSDVYSVAQADAPLYQARTPAPGKVWQVVP